MMALQPAQPGEYSGKFFWIKWVLANAVGFAVGAAVTSALYAAILRPLSGTASESVVLVVSRILAWVSAIIETVTIGAAQWFVLRGRVRWANLWFLVTSLGWLASYLIVQNLAFRLNPFSSPDIASAVISAVNNIVPVALVALPQWLILRRHVSGASLWVAANIAGVAGGFVGYLAGSLGSFIVPLIITPGRVLYMAVSAGLVSATTGASISAITGIALKRLLERPVPETLSSPTGTIRAD